MSTKLYKTYIRYFMAFIIGLVGLVLMLIPFIPFGYAFIILALIILAPKIPFLNKYLRFLKRKDKNGRLNALEAHVAVIEEKIIGEEIKQDISNPSL